MSEENPMPPRHDGNGNGNGNGGRVYDDELDHLSDREVLDRFFKYARNADERTLDLYSQMGVVAREIAENTETTKSNTEEIKKLNGAIVKLRFRNRTEREKLDSLHETVEELEDTKVTDLREALAKSEERIAKVEESKQESKRHYVRLLVGSLVAFSLAAAGMVLQHYFK